MMCLSQTTGYAIRALACLENIGTRPCFVRNVAERTGVPKAYLARIFNRLAHQGIVSAKRGYQGGVTLIRPANQISLLQVVEAVEGKDWIGPCLLGMGCCAEFVCPALDFWQDIRRQVENKLRQTTVADVIDSRNLPKGEPLANDPSETLPGRDPLVEQNRISAGRGSAVSSQPGRRVAGKRRAA